MNGCFSLGLGLVEKLGGGGGKVFVISVFNYFYGALEGGVPVPIRSIG